MSFVYIFTQKDNAVSTMALMQALWRMGFTGHNGNRFVPMAFVACSPSRS